MQPITILLLGALLGAPAAVAAEGHHHHHPGAEAAARAWTAYPVITPAMGGRDRGGAVLRADNLDAATLEVFAPGGPAETARRQFPLAPQGARIEPAAPKLGNYHWVTARQETPERVAVASTAHYFSNPGPAPTALLLAQKSELEIIPQPLPREHGSYRENEEWRFLLRYRGQPLAGKEVLLETEFGTRAAFASDARGVATVRFPADFKPAPEGAGEGHGPRRAKFVLAVEHLDQGRHYLTAFNQTYSPDAYAGRSLMAGAGFGLLGMLLAAPLLRRRKTENAEDPR